MWYKLELQPDDGAWLVTSPDFPEVATFGDTIPEACKFGRDAIEEAIAARMAHNEDLPYPTLEPEAQYTVQMPVIVRMKASLYMVLRTREMTRADLQRLMGMPHREQVDRLLRLDHKTDIETLMTAFEVLGLHVTVNIPLPQAA